MLLWRPARFRTEMEEEWKRGLEGRLGEGTEGEEGVETVILCKINKKKNEKEKFIVFYLIVE